MYLKEIKPRKVLLSNGEWYQCTQFEWLDIIYEELEKEGYDDIPNMTVLHARFFCLGDEFLIEGQNICGYII